MFDLLLRGGDVIDGSGAHGFAADVLIHRGEIVEIGKVDKKCAREVLDVSGLIVAPGFIDAHSHDDRYVLSEPDVPAKVTQGVTTVVSGNCGISLSPDLGGKTPVSPLDIFGDASAFEFCSFSDYLAALDRDPAAVNVYPLLGMTTLRVREVADVNRRASDDEVARMRKHCDEALAAGALGVSIGTFYPPAAASDNQEIECTARALRDFGGVLAVHLRDETDGILDALDEAYSLARGLSAHLVLSHHKLAGPRNHGRSAATLQSIARAAQTQPTGFDVYPYTASSTMLQANRVALAEKVIVTWSQSLPQFAGREIQQIANVLDCSVNEAVERLQPAGATYHMMSQRDVDAIVCNDASMIGSDGLPHDRCPHPRLWGTFPRIFRCYVRERPLIALAEAVRKMTTLPAERFGMIDRGRIAVGMRADVCVFDAARIADRATFEHPTQSAIGVEHVLCNGRFTLRNGQATGERPGQRIKPTDCALRRKR
ncbi:MAG: N-acyl-D-amino-acid deacylase family protein [Casimicrobium sp.]